ncbi:unnamed protein product, partial [Polarella glacialis]
SGGGRWDWALWLLWSEALETAAVVFNSALSACAKGFQWSQALLLFWHMQRSGPRADAVTSATAINACSRGMQWRSALQILAEGPKRGIEPYLSIYNAVEDMCATARGQWRRGFTALAELRRV